MDRPSRSLVRCCSLVLLLAVSACKTPEFGVAVDYDPLTVFPAEASLAWDPERSSVPDDERLAPLELERLIREEGATAFAQHGYRLGAEAGPDYLLSYRFSVLNIVGGEFTRAVGTLWMSLHEPGGRKVWSGGVNADLQVGLSEPERRLRFREMLAALLEGFPPPQRKE